MARTISTITGKKGKVARLLALSAVGALTLAGCGGSSGADGDSNETYKLTLASSLAQSHPANQATTAWIDRIEELTDGRLTIEPIWGGALLSSEEILAGVSSGRADIGQISPPWNMSELPYTSVSTLPFLTYDGEASARALMDLYENNETFKAEYESQGIELVTVHPLDSVLLGSDTGYENVDSLRGAELRAVGEWTQVLSEVGAVPAGIAYNETYEALERGVVDGYGLNWEGVYDIQLHEVAPTMEDPGLGSISNMMLISNSAVWDSFPQDIQDAIEQATQENMDGVSETYAAISEEQCSLMLEKDATFSTWDEADTDSWRELTEESVLEDWLNTVPEATAGQQVIDEYSDAMGTYEDTSSWKSGAEICISLQ